MKIVNYQFPKSAFLSVEKDLEIITNMMFKNDRLKKLLYYTTKDPLGKPNLNEEQTLALFGKNIRIVPKLEIDDKALNYIIIDMDNFTPNGENPEFRDNIISFDIFCHFDQWHLKDFQLRPFKIAAEIDSMFNNKHLTGSGTLQFLGGNKIVLNDEIAGFSLNYMAIHGGEDKKKMPNPADEEQFIKDFDKLFNNK